MLKKMVMCLFVLVSVALASGTFNSGVSLYKSGEFVKAATSFRKSCNEEGIKEACNNYAVMLATGQGVKVDITGAAELYIKSCELGDANACYNAGSILINFSDTLRNFSEVVKLFEKACELGSSEGCYNAANVYVGGINVNIDMDKSAYYFRRSCELSNNNMQACLNAGVIDYDKNIEKSIAYFKKSCDKNNYLGCYNLGIAKIKIATTKGELKEAKSILELACKKNEELACSASKDIQSVINLLP